MKREIWHEIIINASPQEVYWAVTQLDGLRHWWTTDVRGEPDIGKELEFWFDGFCGATMKVMQLVPNKLVQWQVTDQGLEDWANTRIEFKIFKEDGQTFLHFRHSNWDEKASMFPHCSIGWAVFLISLKEFVETGKGRPYPFDMPVNLWTPPKEGGIRDLAK